MVAARGHRPEGLENKAGLIVGATSVPRSWVGCVRFILRVLRRSLPFPVPLFQATPLAACHALSLASLKARSCAFNRTCSWLAASLESSSRFDVMDRSKLLSTLSPHDFGRFGHQLTAFLGGERPDEKGVALRSFARVE